MASSGKSGPSDVSISIAAFGEDVAHQYIIDALVKRIAGEMNIEVTMNWRNAARGYPKMIRELKQYSQGLKTEEDWPDLMVVATDANCKGWNERAKELPIDGHLVPVVLAIPDPHVERWLLLDSEAFKKVYGRGFDEPKKKCERDFYKKLLINALINVGAATGVGTLARECSEEIISAMNLRSATRIDDSLKRFLDDLRSALRQVSRSD
ncbi:MAG: hypothetical protein ISN29_05115 [Gammaproteobacteria bacterium AqS3]|nr:hypothetical protein [Gammaproteobacteria bacterium AqS3]